MSDDLATRIRIAERLDDLGASIEYLPDPAVDRKGRRPFPVMEHFVEPDSGSRIELHAFRQEAGRSVVSYSRTLPPGTGRFGAHLHLDFEERWLVYSGRASFREGRRRGTLEPGETWTVPPGAPHVDPYNEADEPLELLSIITPPSRFAFIYGRTLGQGLVAGTLTGQQQLTTLQLMAVLHATRGETFAAGPPIVIQRHVVIPLLGRLARLRGVRPAVW